ncbi:hypothetical protein QJS10_CPA01g00387 [Acorus calamus]|uniref:Uncharacterized protein n=1 Tax=Acorus calamus TaxID=4465 RepID=A0AAV9FW05_ACOCL|nr:hypothetical protein QJS10_CPA01g00387 [Acorus calamus]
MDQRPQHRPLLGLLLEPPRQSFSMDVPHSEVVLEAEQQPDGGVRGDRSIVTKFAEHHRTVGDVRRLGINRMKRPNILTFAESAV